MSPELDIDDKDRYLIDLVDKANNVTVGMTFEHAGHRITVVYKDEKFIRVRAPNGTEMDLPRNIRKIAQTVALLQGRFK